MASNVESGAPPSSVEEGVLAPGPQLRLAGAKAMRVAGNILRGAQPSIVPSSLGPVRLVPGTVWAGRCMLLRAAPQSCYFTVSDRLYEWQTQRFVQEEWFGALATGAHQATHWESIAEPQAALLCSLFFPCYVTLRLSCAQLTVAYFTHHDLIDDVIDRAPPLIGGLRELRHRQPELFSCIMLGEGRDLLSEVPSGITIENVAFFVGGVMRRAIRGIRAPEPTLRVLAGLCGRTAPLVAPVRAENLSAQARDREIERRAAELQRALNEVGYGVTLEVAKLGVNGAVARGGGDRLLRELGRALDALNPALEQLIRCWKGRLS